MDSINSFPWDREKARNRMSVRQLIHSSRQNNHGNESLFMDPDPPESLFMTPDPDDPLFNSTPSSERRSSPPPAQKRPPPPPPPPPPQQDECLSRIPERRSIRQFIDLSRRESQPVKPLRPKSPTPPPLKKPKKTKYPTITLHSPLPLEPKRPWPGPFLDDPPDGIDSHTTSADNSLYHFSSYTNTHSGAAENSRRDRSTTQGRKDTSSSNLPSVNSASHSPALANQLFSDDEDYAAAPEVEDAEYQPPSRSRSKSLSSASSSTMSTNPDNCFLVPPTPPTNPPSPPGLTRVPLPNLPPLFSSAPFASSSAPRPRPYPPSMIPAAPSRTLNTLSQPPPPRQQQPLPPRQQQSLSPPKQQPPPPPKQQPPPPRQQHPLPPRQQHPLPPRPQQPPPPSQQQQQQPPQPPRLFTPALSSTPGTPPTTTTTSTPGPRTSPWRTLLNLRVRDGRDCEYAIYMTRAISNVDALFAAVTAPVARELDPGDAVRALVFRFDKVPGVDYKQLFVDRGNEAAFQIAVRRLKACLRAVQRGRVVEEGEIDEEEEELEVLVQVHVERNEED